MAFVDTPTRAIVELDTAGKPVGRFQLETHRTTPDDPTYVRVVNTDIDAAAFTAIFDNASVAVAGQLQAAQVQIAEMQAVIAAKDALLSVKDRLIGQYASLEEAWDTQIVPAMAAYREATK